MIPVNRMFGVMNIEAYRRNECREYFALVKEQMNWCKQNPELGRAMMAMHLEVQALVDQMRGKHEAPR